MVEQQSAQFFGRTLFGSGDLNSALHGLRELVVVTAKRDPLAHQRKIDKTDEHPQAQRGVALKRTPALRVCGFFGLHPGRS